MLLYKCPDAYIMLSNLYICSILDIVLIKYFSGLYILDLLQNKNTPFFPHNKTIFCVFYSYECLAVNNENVMIFDFSLNYSSSTQILLLVCTKLI